MLQNRICISACAAPAARGGLYTFALTANGLLVQTDYLAVDRPMYTVLEGNRLHGLLLEGDAGESAAFSVAVDGVGRFGTPTVPRTTHGVEACHLCADGEDVYVVNYQSGSVVRLPDRVVSFCGHGPHPTRQEASHTHCVIFSPDKRYVLATDLGTDTVHVFDRDLNECSAAQVPAGHGARHLLFSYDGTRLYCINELAATVSVFAWDAAHARLTYEYTFDSDVSAERFPDNAAAAIRLSGDGKRLYTSNRGEDTLLVFETEKGAHFRLEQKVPCGGLHPRDFVLTRDERFLVCANMHSNAVSVFALENGRIGAVTDTVSLLAPICVTCL